MSRTVLVTGASSGIGRSTAVKFAAEGWNVAATARNPDALRDLGPPGKVEASRLDVTDAASIREAVDAAFEATSADQVRRQFETNVFGLMETTHALLPHFRERKSGVIVNVSSMG